MALAAWVAWESPARVDIGDLDDVDVGRLVVVEGTVEGTPVDAGDVSVVLLGDGTGRTVPLFLAFPSDAISPGTRLRVTGRVDIYKGVIELVVKDKQDVIVLSRPRSPHVDLDDLLYEPWGFDGMEPVVRVTILTDPMADLNGEDWWCLVTGHATGDMRGALVLFGPHLDVQDKKAGDELELRVAVRYDASSGFVYLEVLELA